MSIYTSKIALAAMQYTATTQWYRHSLGILLTDGVCWLRETLSCYWLIDDIAIFSQKFRGKEDFITADYTGSDSDDAVIRLSDGNECLLCRYKYGYSELAVDNETLAESDFMPVLRLFLIYDGFAKQHVLLLPSEY